MEAIATYGFKGSAPDELTFEKGSLIIVTNKDEDIHWFRAEYQGRDGLVPSNYIEMKSHDWYHGKTSRADAEKALENKNVGCFLIRKSETSPGDFSLSVKCYDGVQHFKVLRDARGKFFIWVTKFESLNELVDYHKESSVSRSHNIRLREIPELTQQKPVLVVAMYNFTPQEEGELEFLKGDIITVTNNSDVHWWHGKLGTAEGLFPAAYVAPYHP